jgi:RNA polymerase sigma factor (sigma-70 family)
MVDVNTSNQASSRNANAEDRFLWDNLRCGNREAFEVIYRKHVNHLFNFGIHIFMDHALVEDAIQDVFIYLWKRHAFLGETDSIKFYLFKSLKREIVRKIREREKKVTTTMIGAALMDQDYCESIESELIRKHVTEQNEIALSKAIQSLSEKQREIIVNRFYYNLSAEQIAAKMSLSIDSTYTLLSRAVRELRKNVRRICVLVLILPFV